MRVDLHDSQLGGDIDVKAILQSTTISREDQVSRLIIQNTKSLSPWINRLIPIEFDGRVLCYVFDVAYNYLALIFLVRRCVERIARISLFWHRIVASSYYLCNR